MGEFNDVGEFNASMDAKNYDEGRTHHVAGIEEAGNMLQRVPPRQNASLSLVMITDGQPCLNPNSNQCAFNQRNCGQTCCCNSLEEVGGRDELLALFEIYNFTFFFLPVQASGQNNAADTTQYDNLLPDSNYKVLEDTAFDELAEFLNGGSFVTPLGPCVEEPVVSSSDRRLLSEEAGKANVGYF